MNPAVKILCVDDEINVLKSIRRLFLDDDYEILTASSGEEGLEILATAYPVPVVISDYRMPGMNGVDFLKQVCLQWPATVRIVLSGYADTAAIVSAINEGQIYKFIPKPWHDDELRVTIAKAVEVYFLQQQNEELTARLQEYNEELKNLNESLEERVVERTNEVLFQNKVLSRAQFILDSLPVGVIGLDLTGMIVQCNQKGGELVAPGQLFLGGQATEIFPAALSAFLAQLETQPECQGKVQWLGQTFMVRGAVMKHPDGQEGLLVVVDSEIGFEEVCANPSCSGEGSVQE